MDIGIFQFIGDSVTSATTAFITPAAQSLIESLRGFAAAIVTIYVFLMGFSIMFGLAQSPTQKMIFKCIQISLIVGVALSLPVYMSFVVGTFESIESGLVVAMGQGSGAGLYATLDAQLARGVELMGVCMNRADDAGLFNFGSVLSWAMAGILIGFGTGLIALLGGAAIIGAKLYLSVLFALGPLFILLLLLPVTARFFDSWVSSVLNHTFVIVIVSVAMTLAMAAFNGFIGDATIDDDINPLVVSMQLFVLTGCLAWLLSQANGQAASLSGGLSTAAISLAHMAAPGRMARNIVDPVSTRRDLQSGMMTTARRSNHIVAGNTAVNPAYSQQLMRQIGRNYGKWQGGNVKQGKQQ